MLAMSTAMSPAMSKAMSAAMSTAMSAAMSSSVYGNIGGNVCGSVYGNIGGNVGGDVLLMAVYDGNIVRGKNGSCSNVPSCFCMVELKRLIEAAIATKINAGSI